MTVKHMQNVKWSRQSTQTNKQTKIVDEIGQSREKEWKSALFKTTDWGLNGRKIDDFSIS